MARTQSLDRLYEFVVGDEDARLCRDIPDAACREQPVNFFAQLVALVATKTGDRLAGPKLVLAWLLGTLGAPAFLVALLVPVRESLALLPQLFVAAVIRRAPVRKWFWVAGSVGQGLSVLGMAAVAAGLRGAAAGWAIIALLVVFSLARGVCSVASKDVLGKTVSKNRRGRLTGFAASAAGIITAGVGLYLMFVRDQSGGSSEFFVGLLIAAATLWFAAAVAYAFLREEPGATEGGANAGRSALASLKILRDDAQFRHFVVTRALLISTALSAPFVVALASRESGGALSGLAVMIVASGLAAWLSAPFWGRSADRSSRRVLIVAAAAAAVLGVVVAAYAWAGSPWQPGWIYPGAFFVLAVIHTGVRVGRKTYLVDMATRDTRAVYVAVSNTVIGALLLAGGAVGFVAQFAGIEMALLVLAILAALGSVSARQLKEVQ